jgi:hypothetical protein
MSSRIPAPCPHDLRPGTVVCLHCRHAEHLAITARQRRTMAMVAAAVLAVGGLASGAVMAFTGGASGSSAARAALVAEPRQATPAADSAPVGSPPSSALELPPADAPTPILPVAAIRAPSLPAATEGEVRPIVAEGRTSLGGGMVAVRSGDTVLVHFDVPNTRTRRADKFERLVRTTLPAVYGAPADAALAAIPDGQLARPGDLLTDLPRRGVRLRTADGATLAVWPQTRPGRDGPLVVTYLATVER